MERNYNRATLIAEISSGNFRAIARALTLVENNLPDGVELLKSLKWEKHVPVIGITGPPGAGKSTLVSSLVKKLSDTGKRVAILAVDPTSPFNFGSLLGDRIRMAELFNLPHVYIRSVATRGALGGVSGKTLEMIDVLKAANFDVIIVETVGVGQSEVEIAGLADKTVVVLVPEAGDEIQNIKSGLMEIAHAFVVNKADRDGALTFANRLNKWLHQMGQEIPIFKTIASKAEGIDELCNYILEEAKPESTKKALLLSEKAYRLIQHKRMLNIDRVKLTQQIQTAMQAPDFNLYVFISSFI
ncbi:MAG: methylmalonyl Co-A mutase-associated GTPase MeaB [Pedobacter sp.]|nr:MAG: methylmalonyl Co-A mutase-associated GTPase MeaB [Pedobacter sp.]